VFRSVPSQKSACASTPAFRVSPLTACTTASLDQSVLRLLHFVGVVIGCLMIITYFPPLSVALRDLVYR
jgi:hypothetical protein